MVRRVEGVSFGEGIEAAVAGIVADTEVIFSCLTRAKDPQEVVVFMTGSAAGEPDGMGFTPIPKPFVDKLAAVAAIEAQRRG
ncbi:MAG: hypothetical protein LBB48_05795 [Treponema sp.]|nr:hypothetical protein [Treponema sp.]